MYRGVKCKESLKLPATKANLAYAARLRGEVINAIERGTFRYPDYFPESKRAALFGHVVTRETVGDLLRASLKNYEQQVANGTMSPSTFRGYRKIIVGRLIPAFDKDVLRDVTPAKLRTWIGGLGVTAKAARNIISPLRSMFDDAMNDGKIEFNPLDRVALKKLLAQTANKSEYEVDPFTAQEIEAILKAASDIERNLYQFWFETGLRQGELIALAWPKLDFIHNKARIDTNIVVKTEKDPKTAAGTRDVELSLVALEALQRQKALTFLVGDRVFWNPRTGKPWETDQQIRRTSWTYLLKKAGVRYRNPYQVRHTFASHHVSNGCNLWWLAKQMGHETIEMIIRHYGKWIPQGGRNLGEKWENENTAGDNSGQQRKTAGNL
jgi:integrase